jgi:hypothetical protein
MLFFAGAWLQACMPAINNAAIQRSNAMFLIFMLLFLLVYLFF